MKQFNKSIQVEIEVDAIAQQLRSQFKEDVPFADHTTELIIGRMLEKDSSYLGRLYQTMNGFKTELLPKVGESYGCEIYEYGYWTPESIQKNDTVRGTVTSCRIVEIFEYSDDPFFVEYFVPSKDGGMTSKTKRISAHSLKGKIATETL